MSYPFGPYTQPYDNHDGTGPSGHTHMISEILGLDTELQADANPVVTKVTVGLGNVDNTSDANKPVSIAQAQAISTAVSTQHTADQGLYVAQNLPAYAGSRFRPYDPFRSVYGGEVATRRPVRRIFDKALVASGTTLVPIVFMGDSETISWKSTLGVNDQVSVFRNRLKALGYPVTGGWIMPGAGFPDSTKDVRVSTTGVWSGFNGTTNNYVWSSASGASVTFAFDMPGTIVEFALAATTTHNVSYQIDGGTVQTVSAVANVITPLQVTGLANTTHTLTITLTSATITWVLAGRCRQTFGVSISNMGIFGSKATDWAPSFGGLFINPYKMATSLETPALAFVGLGANDAGTANRTTLEAAVAAVITSLQPTTPVVLNGYPPLADSIFAANNNPDYPTMASLAASEYNVADSTGCMLIDHNDAMGSNAELIAAGLAYTDQRHLLAPGYADVALRNIHALAV